MLGNISPNHRCIPIAETRGIGGDDSDKNGKKVYKKKALEVDFIARKGSEKLYIQSCLDLNNEDTSQREKRSLYYINDSFRKIIVTKDGLSQRWDDNGFMIIDIFDFLLHPEIYL